MGTTTKEIGSSSFNDMISSVDRRSEYVENRAGANVRLNNFLTPYTLDNKSSILNAPCGYSNGVYASLRPSDARGLELLTSFTNGTTYPLDTFVSSGNNITSMIKSNGFGGCVSNGVSYNENDKVLVSFTYTKNSGNDLRVLFSSVNTGAGAAVTTSTNISDSGEYKLSFTITSTGVAYLQLGTGSSSHSINASITNVSIKKDTSADFDFVRGTAATRVTKDGLIKDVQILSDDLVQNGNFEEIGPEEVSNGDFSQIGSELITNGDFSNGSTGWTSYGLVNISNGIATIGASSSSGIYQGILTQNKSYKVTFDVLSYNGVGNGQVVDDAGNVLFSITETGSHTFYFKHSISQINIIFRGIANALLSIDNVSVKEVGQDWNLSSTFSIDNNKLRCVSDGSYQFAYQNNVFTVGKTYKVTFDILDYVSGSIRVRPGGGAITPISANGSYTLYYTAGSSGTQLFVERNSACDMSITNISVKEVGQNWTFGTGWSIEDGKVSRTAQSGSTSCYQSISFTGGKKYKIQYDLNITAGSFKIRIGGGTLVDTITRTTSGTYTEYIVANSGNNVLNLRADDGAFVGSIDNVSVIEITDDTNLPRIDYTNGTGALLLEPQSTNLFTYSEDFSDSSWFKASVTSISNQVICPDGSTNAYLAESSGTGSCFLGVSYPTLTIGNTYTFSCFAKKGNNNWIRLGHVSSSNTGCWFDLENGVVGTVNSESATIEDYGNGWYRITNTFVAYTSTGGSLVFIGISSADGSTSSGAIGQTNYVWGAQLEQLPYVSSYIPTNGSTVTRNQDQASRSGISNLINSTEGVLYAEISSFKNGGIGDRTISINDGSTQNAVQLLLHNTANRINFRVRNGGSLEVNISDFTFAQNQINKIACKYKAGDYALWINGEQKVTTTSGSLPSALSELSFDDGSLNYFYGRIRSLAVFNEALTDEELAKVTSTTQQEVFYEMRDKMQQIDADYYEFGDYTTRLKKLF